MHLSEVCRVYQPETISKKSLPADGIYPVYGANGKIGLNDKFNHEEPQLLLGCRGSVGSIHISEAFSWINGNAMVVTPFEDLVTRDYLKYALFGGINIKDAISGTAQPQITRESLSKIKIPVPTLKKQSEIIERLDKAFAEINSLEKNLQLKEEKTNQLLQSILSAAFSNTGEFGMKVVKLVDICELISRGISPTYCDNSDLIVINQRCIRNNNLDFTFSQFHNSNLKKVNEVKYLKYGDGLINSTGVGTLGRTTTFVIENNLKYTVDSHVTIARPKLEQLDPGYFKLMLKSLETKFVELATGTSGQTELPRESLNNIEVAVCEKKEDQRILADNVLSSFAEIEKLKSQILIEQEGISSLRQSILSKAFNFEEKAA